MEYLNDNHIMSDSKFSWRRVRDVAFFYRAGVERQVLWYLIISVICAFITLLPLKSYVQVGLFSIIWTVLPLLFELAPCMLAKWGDSRIIERLIPATPAEKYTFRLIYFLIVVPIATQLFPRLAMYLYTQIPAIQTEEMSAVIDAALMYSPILWLSNVSTAAGACLTCLYVVTRARTNRTMKGILSVFAVLIFQGILGAIWGFTTAFRMGLQDGIAGKVSKNSSAFSQQLIEDMATSPFMLMVGLLMIAYFIVMLVLNYRILYRRNL